MSDVLRLEGEIDLENAGKTLRSIDDRLEALGGIDLTDVTYLDSAGIHVLFSVARRARETGRTLRVIVPPTSPVRRLIDVAGLEAVAEISPERR